MPWALLSFIILSLSIFIAWFKSHAFSIYIFIFFLCFFFFAFLQHMTDHVSICL